MRALVLLGTINGFSPSSAITCLEIMFVMVSSPGYKGELAHDPTAICALNVWDDILCCMKFTWRRPDEKARSASTDDAIKNMEISILDRNNVGITVPGAEQ